MRSYLVYQTLNIIFSVVMEGAEKWNWRIIHLNNFLFQLYLTWQTRDQSHYTTELNTYTTKITEFFRDASMSASTELHLF
jgi:hypothetical protein